MSVDPYTFRPSTVTSHALAQQQQIPSSRKILPIWQTPSIVGDYSNRRINPETSQIKEDLRLFTYYMQCWIEITLGASLKRVKTDAQGSRAKDGWQAAHGSFIPHTEDDYIPALIKKVEQNGLTPDRSEQILKNRIKMTSPEGRDLNANHSDPEFVKSFVLSRLSKEEQHSILAGTHYYRLNNTTFENPDESNQYDSRLEKKIASLLKTLQALRLSGKTIMDDKSFSLLKVPQNLLKDGTITAKQLDGGGLLLQGTLSAENSLEWLVNWSVDYYNQSIDNLQLQLENIEKASTAFQKMRLFELAYLNTSEIPLELFEEYLGEVDQFLTAFEVLIRKKEGCPSCKIFKGIRNDFRFLKQLQKASNEQSPIDQLMAFYRDSRRHLGQEMSFDKAALIESYTLYLEEARAQKEQAEVFAKPCVIPNLTKDLFGVVENGHRRAPTAEELRAQIFKMFSVATPEKIKPAKKRKVPASPENKENIPLNNLLQTNTLDPKKPSARRVLTF